MRESILCAVVPRPGMAARNRHDPVWDDVTVLEAHGDLLTKAWIAVGFPDALPDVKELDPPEGGGLWVFSADVGYGSGSLDVRHMVWTQPNSSEGWSAKWSLHRGQV